MLLLIKNDITFQRAVEVPTAYELNKNVSSVVKNYFDKAENIMLNKNSFKSNTSSL